MLCYNVPMTHTFTHLKDQLKEFIPVGQGGLYTLKAALLFTLFAWLQFAVFFLDFGPLTSTDAEMTVAGSYALVSGQSFSAPCSDDLDEVVLDGYVLSMHPQKINLPENLVYKSDVYNKTSFLSNLNWAVIPSDNLLEIQKSILTNPDSSKETVNVYTRANQYNPLAYTPFAIGMKFAMMFGKTSWGILQAARISNFLTYFILALISICINPRGKGIIATIGLLPSVTFCASTLSIDASLIGLCMVYVAYCIKLLDNGSQIKTPQSVIISIMTLILLLLKVPYGALALIYLALPNKIWPAKQKLIAAGVTLACFAVLYGLWSSNFQMVYTITAINYSEQVKYVISHLPKVLIVVIANSFFSIILTTPVYFSYLVIPVVVALVASSLLNNKRCTPNSMLFAAGVAAFLTINVAFLFFLLTWNQVSGGIQNIEGLQDRYLLPLLPLVVFLAKESASSQKSKLAHTTI